MQLNKDEKEALKALKNHPWYKVLLKIHEDAVANLWINLLVNANLYNNEDINILKRNKVFMEARQSFFQDTEKHLREIYSNDSI